MKNSLIERYQDVSYKTHSPDKVNILYILLSLETGGLENGIVNLINNTRNPIFKHKICCLRRLGNMQERIRDKTIPLFCMDSTGNDVTLPFRLAALMRRENIHLVRCMNAEAFFFGFIAAKIARTPVLLYGNGGRSFPEKRHRAWVERLFSRFTDLITVNSDDLKSDMVSQIGIKPDKILVLDNGVDVQRFNRSEPLDRMKVMKSIGLHGEEQVIGTVGRLSAPKDYKTLLRAFTKVNGALPSSRLMIIGDGPLRSELESYASSLLIQDNVLFLGNRNDVAELYPLMNVFVLTSIFEGFSNVIVEAMASSLPVVATNVGANRRILIDGVTGYLTPVGDNDLISEKIIHLLQSPREALEMGRRGRERVKDQFSLEMMVERYESCYQDHLRRKGILV
jgi:sugar transferase (PEP-CTERM/EpsH1 system associated)